MAVNRDEVGRSVWSFHLVVDRQRAEKITVSRRLDRRGNTGCCHLLEQQGTSIFDESAAKNSCPGFQARKCHWEVPPGGTVLRLKYSTEDALSAGVWKLMVATNDLLSNELLRVSILMHCGLPCAWK